MMPRPNDGCDLRTLIRRRIQLSSDDGERWREFNTGQTGLQTPSTAERIAAATVLTGHRREGATLARARGVAATTAEWLAFCDHDDTWPPGRLAALLAAATPQASWIAGRVHLVVEPGYRPPASMLRADGTHVPYLIGASLIRRSVWDDLGGMEPFRTVGDDVDLYLRFRESGRQPALVDAVTLHLHLRPGTTTSNQLDQVATLTFDAMRAAARRRRQPGASL